MDSKLEKRSGRPLHVSSTTADGLTTVPVAGEVDHTTSAQLEGELALAVTSGAQCIEVDFRRVSFCDCSGLNALLSARAHAQEAGVCFGVSGPVAPVVARLLQMAEVEPLLLTRRAA
ncbi:STAS domain-containing protein [Streptomyces sp. NBC_01210]|uniref:STAS domain-containing protein n=1 Tax=Streptomyces sp. NBC_01210 TaxID=2903774 RepID=UPI002E10A42C|nr:STAS domain-containing protein [Streptomyces sp. NBC_01210]